MKKDPDPKSEPEYEGHPFTTAALLVFTFTIFMFGFLELILMHGRMAVFIPAVWIFLMLRFISFTL